MSSPSELTLDCKPHTYSMLLKSFGELHNHNNNNNDQTQKLEQFLSRLEEERQKIDVFKRELPLCMQLLTNAVETSRQQLQAYKGGNQPILEEFIPLKNDTLLDKTSNISDKVNWMTTAQLWSHDGSETKPQTHQTQTQETTNNNSSLGFSVSPKLCLDTKQRNGGAFLPFSKERNLCSSNSSPTTLALSSSSPPDNKQIEDHKCLESENELLCNKSSAILLEQGKQDHHAQTTTANNQTHRKARRCWSPDLHRRFVNALQMLGGSQVATPKQIRELMKVDGLTNDEVKSHLQIINDHTTRGKCYGFVTFRNPRSVIDAIDDMDGKTIDGRVVRVNEVTTRGGRSNFGRERFRRNLDRGMDLNRGRDRVRDYDRDRDRYREQYSERSIERDRLSWDHIDDGERQYDLPQNDRARNGPLDRDQSQGRDLMNNDREEGNNGDWNRERDRDLQKGQDWEMDGTNGDRRIVLRETDQQAREQNEFGCNYQESREHSSDSSGDYRVPVKEKLERSVRRRNELNKEISEMEKRLADKQKVVLSLQKKTQMLEDEFITAKKRSSQHKMQLTKLQKCFLQVNEYTERLKSCEEELQSLVNSSIIDSDLAES